MNPLKYRGRLLAFALALCASSAASAQESKTPIEDALKQIQAQIDALNKKGQTTVTSNTVVIESWLLSAQAIDAAATNIAAAICGECPQTPDPPILVLAGAEAYDFGQVAIVKLEMATLAARFRQLVPKPGFQPALVESLPAIGALIGLLKTETQFEALEQNVDASLVAAAVAHQVKGRLASAVAVTDDKAPILGIFADLMLAADQAAAGAPRERADDLKVLMLRYDALAARLLTVKDGAVPLATAARMDALMGLKPHILTIKTEKSGGTLLKRTNLVTALGGETAFVSGGLVTSYRLVDPVDGRVLTAGVMVCRTALTSLKKVQSGLWKSGGTSYEKPICRR